MNVRFDKTAASYNSQESGQPLWQNVWNTEHIVWQPKNLISAKLNEGDWTKVTSSSGDGSYDQSDHSRTQVVDALLNISAVNKRDLIEYI
ncbi:MAG TPA: hypothetical protein V6C81_09035 [Planktothrix sp.]